MRHNVAIVLYRLALIGHVLGDVVRVVLDVQTELQRRSDRRSGNAHGQSSDAGEKNIAHNKLPFAISGTVNRSPLPQREHNIAFTLKSIIVS